MHFWHSSHTCQSVNTYKRPDTYNVQRQTRATPIEIKVDTQVQSQEVAMNEWKKQQPTYDNFRPYQQIIYILLNHMTDKIS